MVTLLNPPTPKEAPATPSDLLVSEHEKRVDAEIEQLLVDIRRIGPTYPPGSPHCLFGELFDDDEVQQYYEALVGTLKCAKKRKFITFKGQMLLKGMHDDVKISIVEQDDANGEAKTTKVETAAAAPKACTTDEKETKPAPAKPNATTTKNPASTSKQASNKDEYEACLKRQSPQRFTFDSFRLTPTSSPVLSSRRKSSAGGSASKSSPLRKNLTSSPLQTRSSASKSSPLRKDIASSPLQTRSSASKSSPLRKNVTSSPLQTRSSLSNRQSLDTSLSPFRHASTLQQQRSSPLVVTKRKQDIVGMFSDGEAEVFATSRKYLPPPPLGACSDSEADGRVATPRRGRVKLPPVFLAQSSAEGRPPAPWRMRKAMSSMNVTATKTSPNVSRRKSIDSVVQTTKPLARKNEPNILENRGVCDTNNVAKKSAVSVEPLVLNENESTSKEMEPGSPPNTKENDGGNTPTPSKQSALRPEPLKQKSFLLSREASMRVDNEVHQLVKDICRVGSNPGEPSVTFGELFDDETVQDTYEALVGTLRSAKRQGYIDFEGQMLFKGMHDDVTINVVSHAESVV